MRNVQQTFIADHRGGPVPARGAAAGGRQPRRPVGAQPPDRRLAADQDRGEAGAARGGRRRPPAAAPRRRSSRASSRSSRSARRSSPRSSPRSTRASASTSCASSSRRSRRSSASSDPAEAEVDELREQLDALDLPEDVRTQVDRELARLEKLPQAAAEHGVIRTYLEWIASLPWGKATDGQPRPRARARGARRRPLRHRAGQGPHPRVPRRAQAQAGRARLDPLLRRPARRRQDVARAVDRPRARAASSSASASAACATRPRSAATAAPTSARCRGRSSARCATPSSNNPLFMIDEIDKMGSDFRGDPASAMLEVLDPEQNATFRDHYLDVPFDLSHVMFIATANTLDTVPAPLRDRMEVIQLAGYTEEEKLQIAKRYLVPRQIERNGLKRSQIAFTDAGLRDDHRPSTRARPACATSSARSARCAARSRVAVAERHARPQGVGHGPARARAARPAALHARGAAPHRRAGRGDRPGVDAGRRRRAVRRGERRCPARAS